MSLSDADDPIVPVNAPSIPKSQQDGTWGTIFTPHGETSLQSVDNAKSAQWTQGEVEAYLERVKTRATAMASTIISEARDEASRLLAQAEETRAKTDAFRVESEANAVVIAEKAHAEAYEKGYTEGHDAAYAKTLADADDELQALRSNMADAVSGVLTSIEGQCAHIFSTWREDLIAICRLSVEKMVPVLLDSKRASLLEALFLQSVASLERNRLFVIRVHPDDAPVISDIIESTRAKYPEITSWQVQADMQLNPGDLVVESESSLAESRIESRKAAVDTILDHLTLPDSHEP